MKYIYSEHYREDPIEEVEAALVFNSLDSLQITFAARLDNEQRRVPQDTEAIERIKEQQQYIGSLATQESLDAA